ncbi:MAG TPA: glycosyltransferase family 2 protein [Candidatus Dormibacteraeota bacterium]|nr:glycosyltransferase family 2 protein [Candidatus Dormibacteraeota bacterium]
MSASEWIFWICLGAIAYTYAVYPVALSAVCRITRLFGKNRRFPTAPAGGDASPSAKDLPRVSLIVPAFNEENHLADKLRNIDEIDYPSDRFECVFVSDGSTDGTDRILAGNERPGFRFLRLPARQGKPTALNLAVADAHGDILVFSDAATMFEPGAVRKLVRHFADARVGVVCGSLEFVRSSESAATEGVYWRYETELREMEAQIGATLTASGAIYAARRSCYRPLAPSAILDDFLVPMNARRLGYRVEYDPEARAQDSAPASVKGEFARRVRLAAGSFRSLGTLTRGALSGPAVFWSFLSHKALRWLAPVFMIGLLVSSFTLRQQPFYGLMLTFQGAFCLWALTGWAYCKKLETVRFALVGYFLMAMNLAFLVGLARCLVGGQQVTWTRVR